MGAAKFGRSRLFPARTMKLLAAASLIFAVMLQDPSAQEVAPAPGVKLVPIGKGYARNAVNVPIFRKSSLCTHGQTQFAAWYDENGQVLLAKRKLGEDAWQTKATGLQGSLKDAHNAINIGVDGDGFLHIAWDHHNNPLNYRISAAHESLDLVESKMTGEAENSVTYPEFHPLPDGDLLFLYRDGASGRGNLAMNRYDHTTKTWTHLFSKLVDGENHRNAYWQACTDAHGVIHLSWVWRESPDVASNHDMAYACSKDGGKTWLKSTGEPYVLPITKDTAEYAVRIPQNSELINQTSMTADAAGHPYIATYYRADSGSAPQYMLIFNDGKTWKTSQISDLKTDFHLGGAGSKRLPLSRPQILSEQDNGTLKAHVVFRAEERGQRVTLATCPDLTAEKPAWTLRDLTLSSVGQYEPSYDLTLWQRDHTLQLFVEHVEQVDAEGVGTMPPQTVYVAEVRR